MGFLVILGIIGFFIILMVVVDKQTDKVWAGITLFICIMMIVVGTSFEIQAKKNVDIKVTEYMAYKIEKIDLHSKKPMLIRETLYDYSWSFFFGDKKKYEILKVGE